LEAAAGDDGVSGLQLDGRLIDVLAVEVPAIEADEALFGAIDAQDDLLEGNAGLVHVGKAREQGDILGQHAVADRFGGASGRHVEAERAKGDHVDDRGFRVDGTVVDAHAARVAHVGVAGGVVVVDLEREALAGREVHASVGEVQRALAGRPGIDERERVVIGAGAVFAGGAAFAAGDEHGVVHDAGVVDEGLDAADASGGVDGAAKVKHW
jgi:hypothetical protein